MCIRDRVKTLHPKVHGGLLGRAGTDDAVMAEHDIAPIDLLVLNLYPFEAVSKKPGVTFDELIENIDIGGPAMLRSAAKNSARVAVATDPTPVSYTHLDVYKRQAPYAAAHGGLRCGLGALRPVLDPRS